MFKKRIVTISRFDLDSYSCRRHSSCHLYSRDLPWSHPQAPALYITHGSLKVQHVRVKAMCSIFSNKTFGALTLASIHRTCSLPCVLVKSLTTLFVEITLIETNCFIRKELLFFVYRKLRLLCTFVILSNQVLSS